MNEWTKWEYRAKTLGGLFSGPKDDELEAELNEWGEEGWEVIALVPVEGSHKVRLLARRPLSRAVQRRRTWPG